MKPALTHLIFILSTLIFSALAQAGEAPPEYRDVRLPIQGFEAPTHADSKTEAKILVGGYLPSTCYRDARATVESPDPHTHYVRALARKMINRFCTQPTDDYEEVVSLGLLDAGEHTLIVESSHGGVMVERFTVSR